MKTKNHNSKSKTSVPHQLDVSLSPIAVGYAIVSRFKFWLCIFQFSFLLFSLSTSGVGEEISSEQLDPTNLLVTILAEVSQDANMPDGPGTTNALCCVWEPPVQVAGLQQKRQKTQTRPDSIGITPVNFAAQLDKKLSQERFTFAGNQDSRIGHQLWKAKITAPKPEDENDKRSKDELQRIIEQIHSVEFKPPSQARESIIVVEPASTVEPNETLSDTEPPKEPEEKEIKSKPETSFCKLQNVDSLPYEPVTDRTLQMLENLSQHPDRLNNPFELAEVLFLSGHLKQARVFYQAALDRKDADDASLAQDKAWILFQIGSCLRNDNPPMAEKLYRQLTAEYPNSPWTDLAKAREKLIDWYQKDKPQTLIDECGL